MVAREVGRSSQSRGSSGSASRRTAIVHEPASGQGSTPAARFLPSWPRWAWWIVGAVVLLALLGGLGYLTYWGLDRLYPQELWRYFRPLPAAGSGSILYRDLEGKLLLGPVGDPSRARPLTSGTAEGAGTGAAQEIVRDAVIMPDKRAVAYFATERRPGRPDADHVKIIALDGQIIGDVAVAEGAGEPILSSIYLSTSGRYLAVTSRDRSRVYYYDVTAGGALTAGPADAPPEPMLWYRNGDLLTAPFPNQPAYATSPDGRRRAQVREGTRRAPDCDAEPRCEAVKELSVSPVTVTGISRAGVPLYGAYSGFSAEGWGPVPSQPAARFYGRLVWSPDGTQLLFTTQDEANSRVYAITADGKTRPRLILEEAEVLDWMS